LPYSTRWEPRGVVWKFAGRVTGHELLSANHEIYGDARFDEMRYQIVDLTEVEVFDVTEEDMLVVAANDRAAARSRANVRVAVATADEMVRQLSEMYEGATSPSPWTQRVFDSVSAAREWIEDEGASRRNRS
jgi:hypothetical protein